MANIPKTYNGWEAWGFLLSALVYLIKHPTTYGFPLVALLGGGIVNEAYHLSGVTISVGERMVAIDITDPGKPESFNQPRGFSIFPEAFAQDKAKSRTWQSPNAIVADKTKFLGFYDDKWSLWKAEGSNTLIVLFRETKVAREFEAGNDMFDVGKYR